MSECSCQAKTATRNGIPVGVVEGVITSPTPDCGGKAGVPDVLVPGVFSKSIEDFRRRGLPVPLLDHHDLSSPIGIVPVDSIREDSLGRLHVKAEVNLETSRGREIHALAKQGGLMFSVGFTTKRDRVLTDERLVLEADLREVSLVSSGCNPDARITLVKSRAAEGREALMEWKGSEEYRSFNDWCRLGEVGILAGEVQRKSLRTDSSVDGGYLVPGAMAEDILRQVIETDPIRQLARVRRTDAKSLDVPIRTSVPAATFVAEGEQGGASQPAFAGALQVPHRQTVTVEVTADLLQSGGFDVAAEIGRDVATAFAFNEGRAFVVGTGHLEPAGFVTDAALQASARSTAASGVIRASDLIDLASDLKTGYRPAFIMNRRTYAAIRKLRADAAVAADGAGPYLLDGTSVAALLGYPLVFADSMPDIGSGTFPVAFADLFAGSSICDRTGLVVTRDELSQKKRALVEFTWHRWTTGQVVLAEAIRLLKCSV